MLNYTSLLEKVLKDKNLRVIYDSRKVSKGDIFVCIKGFKIDSHNYAQDVAALGARFIVSEKEMQLPSEVELILVDNTRKALAELSAAYFNYPSSRINICGITGTNGKTTTSYMIERIMKRAGFNTGLIGTIELKIGDQSIKTKNTTPESFELQEIFQNMEQKGITSVAMEVSSHALSLYRVWNCYFTGAIYTNFSQDHLDFHPTLKDYWQTKAGFLDLQKKFEHRDGIFSVFNGDDCEVIKLLPRGNGRRFVYSVKNEDFENDKDIELIVADVVNCFSERDLAHIIYTYGEEVKSRVIAREIVKERQKSKIISTGQLAGIISRVVPSYGKKRLHPATRTFMALRIWLNKELEAIEEGLKKGLTFLKPGGRMVVISFHSLEDRIVKKFFKNLSLSCRCPKNFPVCRCEGEPLIRLITRKPVVPSQEELAENLRARSAKLRAIEKLPG